jgi:hypothetical protein
MTRFTLALMIAVLAFGGCRPRHKVWIDGEGARWEEVGMTKGDVQLKSQLSGERINVNPTILKLVFHEENK